MDGVTTSLQQALNRASTQQPLSVPVLEDVTAYLNGIKLVRLNVILKIFKRLLIFYIELKFRLKIPVQIF